MKALMIATVVLACLVSTTLSADEIDGNPALCQYFLGHGDPSGDGGLSIRSSCEDFDPGLLISQTDRLASFLEEMERDLWGTGRLPRVIYSYHLEIKNDSKNSIELNLGESHVTHSPYTWAVGSLVYDLPACSRMLIWFLSPWPPEMRVAANNIGIRNEDGEWGTIGSGRTSILTPVWFQYYTTQVSLTSLPPADRHSNGCTHRPELKPAL